MVNVRLTVLISFPWARCVRSGRLTGVLPDTNLGLLRGRATPRRRDRAVALASARQPGRACRRRRLRKVSAARRDRCRPAPGARRSAARYGAVRLGGPRRRAGQIGRASGGERGCVYVWSSGGAAKLTKKTKH